jgi:hypothetical protein
MPAWGGVPPITIPVPTNAQQITLDRVRADAVNFDSIAGGEIDMRSFVATTTGNYRLNTYGYDGLDTVLAVYDSAGNRLAYNDDSGGTRNSDLTVFLRSGQRYYSGVASYNGNTSGSYLLFTDGQDDDAYEDNDTSATAYNLGSLTGPLSLSSLKMLDSGDFFRFTTTTTCQLATRTTAVDVPCVRVP